MNSLFQSVNRYIERRKINTELHHLKQLPRFTSTTTRIFQNIKFNIVDPASFIFQYKEIFQNHIYQFTSQSISPIIIDCGANIGLSIIYFKKIHPKCRLVAFEPDVLIFSVLEKNIGQFGYSDVKLINSAVWSENTMLPFLPDGSDGGRVLNDNTTKFWGGSLVSAVSLADYLNESVDLLKIDIEGAELQVLQSCQDKLKNVKYLFIEYHSFVNKKQELDQLLSILSKANFRVYINPIFIKYQPFMEKKNNSIMDMQLNIFAIREK